MSAPPDFVALALTMTRDEFVRMFPHCFLLGETILAAPTVPRNTGAFAVLADTNPGQWESDYTEVPAPVGKDTPTLHVFAIHKAQTSWPGMITVGRTRNNDIVINDTSVSKFHAYFRIVDGHLELVDAGSLVGTWVGDTRLPQKGNGVRLTPGQTVRFAHHEFQVLDAGDCWTRLRAHGTGGRDTDAADSLS